MYKKLVLLLTFIVSFIVSINCVKADYEKLFCIYENNKTALLSKKGKPLIVRNTDGTVNAYYSKSKTDFNFETDVNNYETVFDSTNIQLMENKDNKLVTSSKIISDIINLNDKCPKYVDVVENSNGSTVLNVTFEAKDNGGKWSGYSELLNEKLVNSENSNNANNNNNSSSTTSKNLECWYKNDSSPYVTATYKMEQDSNGKRNYYSFSNNTLNEKELIKENITITSAYANGNLTECPKCMEFDLSGQASAKVSIKASDAIGDGTSCSTNYSKNIPAPSNSGSDSNVNDELKCEEKWTMVCKYGYNKKHSETLILSFNETELSLQRTGDFVPESVHYSTITIDKIVVKNENGEVDVNGLKCPQNIYSFKPNDNNGHVTREEFYLAGDQPGKADRIYTQISYKNCKDSGEGTTVFVVNNCRDLFGEDLIEIINTVMKYIGIIVPILLLIFGVSDFFSAIFVNDQDAMVEKRKKFFKRLIAAVIVFVVPIFVKVVLSLANSVWSNIHADTCVNENN